MSLPTSSKVLPLILALNNIRSLHNVGALFRSADAVKLERICLGGLTPTTPRHEIEKTALGATVTVKWEYQSSLKSALTEYKAAGYTIYALEQTSRATSLFSTPLQFPCVLIAGHEREGVEADVLDLCDQHLFIPMYGTSAHSLNVSTSTTVALYHFRTSFDAVQ